VDPVVRVPCDPEFFVSLPPATEALIFKSSRNFLLGFMPNGQPLAFSPTLYSLIFLLVDGGMFSFWRSSPRQESGCALGLRIFSRNDHIIVSSSLLL